VEGGDPGLDERPAARLLDGQVGQAPVALLQQVVDLCLHDVRLVERGRVWPSGVVEQPGRHLGDARGLQRLGVLRVHAASKILLGWPLTILAVFATLVYVRRVTANAGNQPAGGWAHRSTAE
jgi:hypothetical protein